MERDRRYVGQTGCAETICEELLWRCCERIDRANALLLTLIVAWGAKKCCVASKRYSATAELVKRLAI
jgi:hypothetical protein